MLLPILLNKAVNTYKMAMSYQHKAFKGQEGGVKFGIAGDTNVQSLRKEICSVFVLSRVDLFQTVLANSIPIAQLNLVILRFRLTICRVRIRMNELEYKLFKIALNLVNKL